MVSTGVKIALPYVVLLIIWCVFREPGIRCCQCSRSRLTALPWGEGWLAELPTSVSDQSYAWRTLSFHFFSELRNPNRLEIFTLSAVYSYVSAPCRGRIEYGWSCVRGLWASGGALFWRPLFMCVPLGVSFLCLSLLSSGEMQGCLLSALLGGEMPAWSQLPLAVTEKETASFFCLSLFLSSY